MCVLRSVDSLTTIVLKNICTNINDYVTKNPDAIAALPVLIKDKIFGKITRCSLFLRDLNPTKIFPLLIHKNLIKLDLSYVRIDDKLLELFETCTSLRDLRFCESETQCLSPVGLCKFLQNKKKLRTLHLAQCQGVTDDVVKVIVENCRELNGLVLRGCGCITDVSMDYLATMDNLIWLDFSGTMITDSGIKTLSKGNSKEKITELRIAYCPKITFGVLSSVVESFINMEVLEFHNCCESPGEYESQLQAIETTKMKHLKQLTFTISW